MSGLALWQTLGGSLTAREEISTVSHDEQDGFGVLVAGEVHAAQLRQRVL